MNAVDTAPNHRSRPTIVVGVDASLSARIALEHAGHRARPGGRLLVATVVPPLSDALARAVSGLRDERRAAAQRLVDRLAAEVAVETETRVLEGAPAEQLAELARESGADEIVVGSRGTGRFAAALGSVSHALLAHADHPVVVVPGRLPTTRGPRTPMAKAASWSATTARRHRRRRLPTRQRGLPAAAALLPSTRSSRCRTGLGLRVTRRRSTRIRSTVATPAIAGRAARSRRGSHDITPRRSGRAGDRRRGRRARC